MTQSRLTQRIAHTQPLLAPRDVEHSVNVMLEHMAAWLAAGGRIETRGFGTVSLRYRPARGPRATRGPERRYRCPRGTSFASSPARRFASASIGRLRTSTSFPAADDGSAGGAGALSSDTAAMHRAATTAQRVPSLSRFYAAIDRYPPSQPSHAIRSLRSCCDTGAAESDQGQGPTDEVGPRPWPVRASRAPCGLVSHRCAPHAVVPSPRRPPPAWPPPARACRCRRPSPSPR